MVIKTTSQANVWTRLDCIFDLSSDASTRAVLIITNDGGAGVDMWFDGIMLESQTGDLTTPSAYQESPNFLTTFIGDLSATKNTLYRQTAAPTGGAYTTNDLWFDTDSSPSTLYQWNGAAWGVVSNSITNTNQITDGANLGVTAVWANVTSVPGNLSALGGTETIRNSLILENSGNNLVTDDSLNDPVWWGMGTAFPSNAVPFSGTVATQPFRFFTLYSLANFEYYSKFFAVTPSTRYKIRLSMYLSADFAGFVAPLVHVPSVAWACPGATVADPASIYPAGHTAASWGVGSWITREAVFTSNSDTFLARMQSRLCGRITAGYAQFALEVVKSIGQFYRQTTAPTGGIYTTDDLWFDTDSNPPLLYQWSGSAWVVVANNTTNTNQLSDGAGLGLTAAWGSVSSRPTSLATLNSTDGNTLASASSNAAAAMAAIGDIVSDSVLSALEKSAVRKEWDAIASEKGTIESQADTYAISAEKATYDNAFIALSTYLNAGAAWSSGVPSWITDSSLNAGASIAINGTTFRDKFKAYYDARVALIKKVTDVVKTNLLNTDSRLNTRPNLVYNGGFENGLSGWGGDIGLVTIEDNSWGRTAMVYNASGTGTLTQSGYIPVQPLEWYTIAGDSLFVGTVTGGSVYFDIQWLTSAFAVISDSAQNVISAVHDFSITDANRAVHAISVQAPANAAYAKARFVWSGIAGTSIVVGCQQIKIERGTLPATPYTADATLPVLQNTANTAKATADAATATLAAIASDGVLSRNEKPAVILEWNTLSGEQAGIVAQAGALSVSHSVYDAALAALGNYLGSLSPNWGDANYDTTIVGATFRQKFVDVYVAKQDILNAMAAKAATLANWSSVASVPGNLSALDGTETIRNSLILENSGNNLVTDDSLNDPVWWGMGTAFPSNAVPFSGTVATQPFRFFTLYSLANFEYYSKFFAVTPSTRYKIRLSMYLSADFAGFVAPLVHVPSVAWACPGATVADPASIYPAGHTAASWGVGSWITREAVFTSNSDTFLARMQSRLCGRITAGYAQFALEVVKSIGQFYRQTTAPTGGIYTTDDLWFDTDSNPPLLYQWSGSAWVVVANNTTNTNQLSDGAGLGQQALWTGVSGTGKPADNATVGAIIGANVSGQITAGNASTFIANAAIGSAQIGSIALVGTSNFSVKSAAAGARTEMDSQVIKVFDSAGVCRVKLGNLA
jgi:hypothetical protein